MGIVIGYCDAQTPTPPIINLEPTAYEYVGHGTVMVSLTSSTGEVVKFATSASSFMRSINMAVDFVNQNLTEFLTNMPY